MSIESTVIMMLLAFIFGIFTGASLVRTKV